MTATQEFRHCTKTTLPVISCHIYLCVCVCVWYTHIQPHTHKHTERDAHSVDTIAAISGRLMALRWVPAQFCGWALRRTVAAAVCVLGGVSKPIIYRNQFPLVPKSKSETLPKPPKATKRESEPHAVWLSVCVCMCV